MHNDIRSHVLPAIDHTFIQVTQQVMPECPSFYLSSLSLVRPRSMIEGCTKTDMKGSMHKKTNLHYFAFETIRVFTCI